MAGPGEWVRYSTPEGAEYVAICVPAFTPDTVHSDEWNYACIRIPYACG